MPRIKKRTKLKSFWALSPTTFDVKKQEKPESWTWSVLGQTLDGKITNVDVAFRDLPLFLKRQITHWKNSPSHTHIMKVKLEHYTFHFSHCSFCSRDIQQSEDVLNLFGHWYPLNVFPQKVRIALEDVAERDLQTHFQIFGTDDEKKEKDYLSCFEHNEEHLISFAVPQIVAIMKDKKEQRNLSYDQDLVDWQRITPLMNFLNRAWFLTKINSNRLMTLDSKYNSHVQVGALSFPFENKDVQGLAKKNGWVTDVTLDLFSALLFFNPNTFIQLSENQHRVFSVSPLMVQNIENDKGHAEGMIDVAKKLTKIVNPYFNSKVELIDWKKLEWVLVLSNENLHWTVVALRIKADIGTGKNYSFDGLNKPKKQSQFVLTYIRTLFLYIQENAVVFKKMNKKKRIEAIYKELTKKEERSPQIVKVNLPIPQTNNSECGPLAIFYSILFLLPEKDIIQEKIVSKKINQKGKEEKSETKSKHIFLYGVPAKFYPRFRSYLTSLFYSEQKQIAKTKEDDT